jgi:signal peptidase II
MAGAGRRVTNSLAARLWGPWSALAAAAAVAAFLIDQASKWWMLLGFDIESRQPVALLPVLDLVLVWNRGVSYGWFASHAVETRLILIALSLFAAGALWIWAASTARRATALGLGLVIGGALGNGLDRVTHGAVVDFIHLHYGAFSWYVFNLADVAIVAGVGLLLYDALTEDSPRSGRP